MGLDQVEEQNNQAIKWNGGATDLVNKRDNSSVIHVEICGPGIARIMIEFEESEGIPLTKSTLSIKQHEDNNIFCKKFELDIKIL